jgi:hypothetical protein
MWIITKCLKTAVSLLFTVSVPIQIGLAPVRQDELSKCQPKTGCQGKRRKELEVGSLSWW